MGPGQGREEEQGQEEEEQGQETSLGVGHLLATPQAAEGASRPLFSDQLLELVQPLPSTRYLLQRGLNSGRRVPKEIQLNLLLQDRVLQTIAAINLNPLRDEVVYSLERAESYLITEFNCNLLK